MQEAKCLGIPINLPPTNVTFFAGRDDDLVKMHELLQKNQRVAVSAFVKGMGGVGKSELALQYALRHLLTDYSGGICWLRGNEGTLPTQLQDFVQVQLGETMPDGLDSGEKLAGHCWRRLSKRVEGLMLVVLDDVKDYENVELFLPPLDGKFRVLATTRLMLGNAMQQYTLDVLELVAAVDLLKSFLPEVDPRRGSDTEIKRLCEWLGRLPLAIELVGRYLARKPDLSIVKMQERLEEKKLQQDALTDKQRRALAEMTAKLNVAAAFDLSWQELSEGAQRLACLLSLFALAPIHWQWVMDAMINVGEEKLEACRDNELLNLHLLERTQQGVYELHQLLREYFQFQLQQNPNYSQIISIFFNLFENIAEGFSPTKSSFDNLVISEPHLREAIILKNNNNDYQLSSYLFGLGKLSTSKGNYNEAEKQYKEALSIRQNQTIVNHLGIADILNDMGLMYLEKGEYSKSDHHLSEAFTIRQSHSSIDYIVIASSLNNFGLLRIRMGEYDQAEKLLLEALSIRELHLPANDLDIATSLNNLAMLYYSRGRYIDAEPLWIKARLIREEKLGLDHPAVATICHNLASGYERQGKYTDAEELYLKARSIRKDKLGDNHQLYAITLSNLAGLYKLQNRFSDAENLYMQTHKIFEKRLDADHPNLARSFRNIADNYRDQGKYIEAEPSYLRAIEINTKNHGENHLEVAIDNCSLAKFYVLQKYYGKAEKLYKQAIPIVELKLSCDHPNFIKVREEYALLRELMGG